MQDYLQLKSDKKKFDGLRSKLVQETYTKFMKSQRYVLDEVRVVENDVYGLVLQIQYYAEADEVLLDNLIKILEVYNEYDMNVHITGREEDTIYSDKIYLVYPNDKPENFELTTYAQSRDAIINYIKPAVGKVLFNLQKKYMLDIIILSKPDSKNKIKFVKYDGGFHASFKIESGKNENGEFYDYFVGRKVYNIMGLVVKQKILDNLGSIKFELREINQKQKRKS
jgi:hypothetical protein